MIRHPKLTKDTEYEIERVELYDFYQSGELLNVDCGYINLNDSVDNYQYINIISGNYVGYFVDIIHRWFDVKSIVYTSLPEVNNTSPDMTDICVYTYASFKDASQNTYFFQIDVRFKDNRTIYWESDRGSFPDKAYSFIRKIFGYRLKKKNIKLLTQFLSNLYKLDVVLC